MAAQALESPADIGIDGTFTAVRGEFYSDDYGLTSTPPRPSVAAALTATTVAIAALAVYGISEIAGHYIARPRGGVS